MTEFTTPQDITLKRCSKCKEYLPETREYFYWRNDTGKFASECKTCRTAHTKQHYQNNREKIIAYQGKYKQGYRARYDRQQGDGPNPEGLCMCGCGQKTGLAKRTDKRYGLVEGNPVRFIVGHGRRMIIEGPNPSGLCMCGCGQPAPITEQTDAKRGVMKGQPACYIIGHGDGIRRATAARTTHGMSSTRDYKLWIGIKRRCYSPKCGGYANYGGRGIQMHDSWRNDFMKFHAYIIRLPHYGEEGYSIDRIDNNGDYEPGNVRWANRVTQANNGRKNVLVEFHGETHTVSEWAHMAGLPPGLVSGRLKLGWDIETALNTPYTPGKTTRRTEKDD